MPYWRRTMWGTRDVPAHLADLKYGDLVFQYSTVRRFDAYVFRRWQQNGMRVHVLAHLYAVGPYSITNWRVVPAKPKYLKMFISPRSGATWAREPHILHACALLPELKLLAAVREATIGA